MMRPPLLLALAFGIAGVAACEKSSNGGGGDETPPEVDSTSPANGATASVSVVVSATFSEEMDPLSVTDNTFRLTTGGTIVPGTVAALDASALTFTFTPTSALESGAAYTAQILDEVADDAGNTLESAYSWSFTTSSGEFVLSSTAFAPGAPIPATHTCDGSNVSPALTWTAGPPGTESYAIVFTDLDNSLIHWAIWDIPSTTLSLIQGIPNDALPNPPGGGTKQVESYDNATFGYLGPCPPSIHTYQFQVYAIDPATLPNVTTGSTRTQVETEILLNDLGSATLSGTYDPP